MSTDFHSQSGPPGREQQLIRANGGAQSEGGTSGNAINAVSPNNPKAQLYDEAAQAEAEAQAARGAQELEERDILPDPNLPNPPE